MPKFQAELDLDTIMEELERADKKHGPMLDPVEGLCTLKCEIMELERELSKNPKNMKYEDFKLEITQTAAMGLKLFKCCSSVEMFQEYRKSLGYEP